MHKTLSALVIHDLKNALALLEIDLEQLNHHENLPPEARRAYRRCVDLKGRLIGFLTLYKHEQSGLNPMLVEVDLPDFIEDLVRNSQSLMTAETHHGHPISIRALPMKSGAALFDENLVELALESALSNAVRYARSRVDVWFEQSSDALVFKVLDDGADVTEENELMQRKIAEKSSSTGLGLALCKAVAQAHGSGSVQLERVDGGTLFSMTLNVCPLTY